MKRLLTALPLLIVFVLMAHLSYAPPLPPAGIVGAPLDGFTIVLIALGSLYGVYYIRKKRNTEAA